ncbi:MAG: threonine synthase, partial [Candidatus Eremiobacteraeota bacterium]|nr:threonine synthase [Candidatus Eremiobacteraeota bacterium]
MLYRSTRGQVDPLPFSQAVLMGLADDGGLLVPESVPQLSDLAALGKLGYPDLAFQVMKPFVDLDETTLRTLLEQSYGPDYGGPVAPVRDTGPFGVLELFHGPTLAFKD